jgi:spermidine/putrescine-binding protein
MLYATVLAYNTEQMEATPSSWVDFFDTGRFPGRRGLWKFPTGAETLEVALLGDVQTEIDAGTPVEIQWNQNLQTADNLVVPKGTANKEEAMRLIAYCVSAQNNHRLSEYIEYAPINKESISKVDPQVASRLPTAHREVGVTYNAQWWDNNRVAVTKRFNEWVRS